MKRNNFFSRFIVVTLTAALLLMSGSRAIPVSALADPSPVVELFPVYDTTIVQFSDYVENLTDPQFEIMKIALGLYVATQAGSQNYTLNDPFANSDSVIDWLKSVGIEAYNSIISLTPDTIRDPITGSIISTVQLKDKIKFMVAYGMGAAVLAANYQTEQDFLDDIDNSTNFFIKYGVDIQPSIKDLIAINGGFYNWQFTQSDWDNDFTYTQYNMTGTLLADYNSALSTLSQPRQLGSSYASCYNFVFSQDFKFDLFINNQDHKVQAIFDNPGIDYVYVYERNYSMTVAHSSSGSFRKPLINYNPENFMSYQDIANYFLSGRSRLDGNALFTFLSTAYYNYTIYFPYALMVDRVLVGPNLENAVEIQNLTDLDFALNNIQWYEQITNDYLLDIKGYINSLIDTVDLYTPWITNLFTPDGIRVTDPQLTRIAADIYDILDEQNPPLPVNLNDIAAYTDNTYLDRVKEHARNAGDIFANYVAFWHNCDPDLVYTIFGAAILVLVGAFVGKWGHS